MMRCILNWFSVRMIASLITTRLQLVVEEEKIHASRGLNEEMDLKIHPCSRYKAIHCNT